VTNAFCRQITICSGKKISAAAWKDMQPSLQEITLPRLRRTARQGDPAGIKPCPQRSFLKLLNLQRFPLKLTRLGRSNYCFFLKRFHPQFHYLFGVPVSSLKGLSSMKISPANWLAILASAFFLLPLPGEAQSICYPVSNNPLVMENLCNSAPPRPSTSASSGQISAPPTATPHTLTALNINSVVLRNAPPIQAGDNLLMEANRGDFQLALLLDDGKVIVTGPHATTATTAWRTGRIKLAYPGAVNKRIVGMRVRLLHDGGEPLLLRAIKFQRHGRVILALAKRPPAPKETAAMIEPPMSYPPDPMIPNPHMANMSLPGPETLMPHPDSGFHSLKAPAFPMMFQTTTTTGDPNHYKFNGKELDAETGLYNYGARYYNPALSRFMSPDWSAKPVPIPYVNLLDPQTLNLYAYVRNNPTSLPDPDGHAIQLSDNADDRKKQLAAAQQAVGKNAGKYLYDNTDKNGHHYIGIYSNGPDGKGPAFKDINGASNKLNSIIGDSRTVFVSTVSPGTNVLPNLSPNGIIGSASSGVSPGGSRPINQQGDEVLYLTSGDPGKLRADLSSTGREAPITPGDVFSHETGHIFARWFGGDSNTSSVQMENNTRRLNGEPLRTGHGERNDVPLH
jgi:RHS repeat-associated protein